jgi:hypothetical protein
VDQLTQAQLQEIFQQLKSAPLPAAQLSDEALNRAAVQGLLQRLGTGFSIVAMTALADAPKKLVSELLSAEIGYLRPAAMDAASLTSADSALEAMGKSTATTLILDLRSPAQPSDAASAAQWLSRFLPAGTPLFQVRQSAAAALESFIATGTPLWTKPVLVLIDQETSNTAEAVAAVLQREKHYFLIGQATLGQPIRYGTKPLTETLEMRWAQAELMLTADTSLYNHGLIPDLEMVMDFGLKRQQFLSSETTGMKRYAYETERPRLNEAALVARTNPELDYKLAQSAHETSVYDAPATRDPVLQQALDFLTAQAFLKAAPTSP